MSALAQKPPTSSSIRRCVFACILLSPYILDSQQSVQLPSNPTKTRHKMRFFSKKTRGQQYALRLLTYKEQLPILLVKLKDFRFVLGGLLASIQEETFHCSIIDNMCLMKLVLRKRPLSMMKMMIRSNDSIEHRKKSERYVHEKS